MHRPIALQTFLDATRDAFAASCATAVARALAERIFTAARIPAEVASPEPLQLPACVHLAAAIDRARAHGGPAAVLADALDGVAPRLCWTRRPNGENDDAGFQAHHANAVVVGTNGLEARDDIRIGISLLAPATRYPDHRHPPEEIYTVLSPGEWKQNQGPWRAPGVGGFVHNPPNIIHGMRSKDVPLLAVWCLWEGQAEGV